MIEHAGLFFLSTLLAVSAVSTEAPLKLQDASLVREVESGARTTASAAWWGFDAEDSTDNVQAALDSNAKILVVPYMGAPWIVRPLKLHGNQEIQFEPGVLVLAKKGEFRGKGDSLFTATDAEDLTLRGYGATLRMRKKDYQNAPYEKAEWRMGVALHGCKNVLLEGLRIESTGGDGVYVDGSAARHWSEGVTVRNVACIDNHRQGISVISAKDLLIEGCNLSETSGTAPESGIDIEPDTPDHRLINCVIRNCLFENNAGNAAAIYLKPLTRESGPVTITFENCIARMGKAGDKPEVVRSAHPGGWGGYAIGTIKDDGPAGLIEFRNCVSENTGREGARIYDKSVDGALLRFVNCSWKNAWLADPLDAEGPRAPISITLRRPDIVTKLGGIEFVDCHVYDSVDRPALVVHEEKPRSQASPYGVANLTGNIIAHNPHGARADFGPEPRNVPEDLVKAAQ